VLGGIEPGLAASAGAIGQGVGPAAVVAAGPFLDGSRGAAQGRGDRGGGLAGCGRYDPAEATPEARRRLTGGEVGEFLVGVVGLDMPRGGSSVPPRS
jgi:hypothetical protein